MGAARGQEYGERCKLGRPCRQYNFCHNAFSMKHFATGDRPKPKLKASHVWRDLRELIWPRRKLFIIGLILTFINRGASLVLPGSTKFLIDDVVQKHRQELLFPIAAAVAGAVIIQAITSYT